MKKTTVFSGMNLFTLRAVLYRHRYPHRKPPSRKDLTEPAWNTAGYDRWVASLGEPFRGESVEEESSEENEQGAD